MVFEIYDRNTLPRVFTGPLQQTGTEPPLEQKNPFVDDVNNEINIIVLDDYKFKYGENGELIGAHGEIVVSTLLSEIDDNITINIEKIEGLDKNIFWDHLDILDGFNWGRSKGSIELKNILKRLEKGEDIDAVNYSMAAHIPFDEINRVFHKYGGDSNIKITKDNIGDDDIYEALIGSLTVAAMRDEKMVSTEEQKIYVRDILEGKSLMEEIEKKGCEIYIAGGNRGPDVFNMRGLAKEVDVVGALDENGIAPYSANNSMIDRFVPGLFEIYTGTSFAAPRALAYDINNELESKKLPAP